MAGRATAVNAFDAGCASVSTGGIVSRVMNADENALTCGFPNPSTAPLTVTVNTAFVRSGPAGVKVATLGDVSTVIPATGPADSDTVMSEPRSAAGPIASSKVTATTALDDT